MTIRHVMLIVIAAAVTITSIAAARPSAMKQGVVTTSQSATPSPTAPFTFAPVTAGKLKRDSGTETCRWPDPRVVVRDGQRIEIQYNAVCTDKRKLGSLTTRSRIECVNAGNGYHVGAGTWTVVRGTGQYAGVTGGGRTGNVWLDRGPWSGRFEGVLTLP